MNNGSTRSRSIARSEKSRANGKTVVMFWEPRDRKYWINDGESLVSSLSCDSLERAETTFEKKGSFKK